MGTEVLGDRRPIASRERRFWQQATQWLVRAGVSGNSISILGMIAGMLGGVALFLTSRMENEWAVRALFLAAACLMQLRLVGNMLDGMVAIASGKVSRVGELYNEIPDRFSDTAIFLGAGWAIGGAPAMGWAATAMALFVTYIRALGKGAGVLGLYQGPMSKSHRMFVMTVACVYLGFMPGAWGYSFRMDGLGVMAATLGLVVAGGIVTAWRRVARIRAVMKGNS
jgi:phosphatidylglycerophosphate synthase